MSERLLRAHLPPRTHTQPPQNFVSKWIEADWVAAAGAGCASATEWAAAHPGAGALPRVHCSWNHCGTATGRLSSSSPNLQVRFERAFLITNYSCCARLPPRTSAPACPGRASCCSYPSRPPAGPAPGAAPLTQPSLALVTPQAVTKYQLEAAGAAELINIRDAFAAPPGHVLIAADYSQVGWGWRCSSAGWRAALLLLSLRLSSAAGPARCQPCRVALVDPGPTHSMRAPPSHPATPPARWS